MSAISIKTLKANGISAGHNKLIFTQTPAKRPTRVNKLIQLIADRCRDGKMMNLRDYRTYWAIDEAYAAPFQQITPTLIKSFLDHPWESADEAFKALQGWGLREKDLFVDVKTDDGGTAKMLNPPFLYQILVPIVKSYTTIRLAKIFNERDTNPLLPYSPLKLTTRNQVLCEVLTDLVNTICTNYGYPAIMRESIMQMLKYGISLAFPREVWHTEEQIIDDGSPDGKTITTKEGIRYFFPHPTRMFFDLLHPLTSFNTDTGCEYAGYWHIVRYGDILDNRSYWNRESVWYGTNWFAEPLSKNYFTQVYPCQLKFPDGIMPSENSRENRAAYYSTATRDKAIFITEHFMKLVPKDWGLGEYEDSTLKKLVKTYSHPVWHRFVIAGDDTIIYAEPVPYCPNWFMGYDYDPQCARTSSLALETIPWQDLIGNTLSQIILTGKQNLANVTFYDSNAISGTDIRSLQNSGSKQYVSMNFIPVDTMKFARQGVDQKSAFWPVQLNKQNIQEQFQIMSSVLSLLERVLQITAQEAGAAASHQQSKAEIVQTGSASTNRLTFTSSYVDEGIDAWQRQLHDAWQNYGNSEIEAEINPDLENLDAVLKEIGFTVEKTKDKTFIKGKKDALRPLRLESFARRNNGPETAEDAALSQIIFSVCGTIAGQPALFEKVGAKNILALLEEGARLGGSRKDFKLPMLKEGESDDAVPENILNAIKQAQAATLQTISEKALQPIAQEMSADKQEMQQILAKLQELGKIYEAANAAQDKQKIKTAEAQQKMQIRQAQFQSDEQRKNAALTAQIERDAKRSEASSQIAAQEAASRVSTHATVEGVKTAVAAHAKGAELAISSTPAKESVSLSYKDLPSSVQRQAEAKAGFQPATESPAELKAQKTPTKAPAAAKSGK